MPKFTDDYGDTLDVRLSAVNTVILEVDAVDEDADESIVLAFSPAAAIAVAKAIVETAGYKAVDVSANSAENMTFNEAMLRLAAIHKRTVTFSYAKHKGEFIETRRLHPTSVAATNDGNTVVYGDDPDRDAKRSYRLDRIKGEVTLA